MAQHKKLGDLKADRTVFFLCDMQERFRPAIKYFADILEVAKRLDFENLCCHALENCVAKTAATRILDIPLVVAEQSPGNTVPELDISNAVCTVPKTKFSMVLPKVEEQLKTLCDGKVEHIVLFGIEAHVCIQQTVIDLLQRGYEVHVVADGCSSRSQMDRMFAFERFRHMGATVTTSEAVLLQLVADKDHPKFKEVQGLIKISAPESGLTQSSL